MEFFTSVTIRNNKLYTIYQDDYLGQIKLKVYEIKGEKTIEGVEDIKTVDLFNDLKGFNLEFIDTLDNVPDSDNKLWMRAELNQNITEQINVSYINWVGYINLDDMSLKADQSYFKFPVHENFPLDQYTINRITNEFGSALYITGGGLYSKKDNKYSIGNSFFKYNLTTKEWVDMTYLANGKLKPIVQHKAAVIYNRYLVIFGGFINYSNDSQDKLKGNVSTFERYSRYNLTVFDTHNNSWENVNIEPNVHDTSIAISQLYSFSTAVYEDKVYIFGGHAGNDDSGIYGYNPYMGILDYNSRTWSWKPINANPIKTDDTHVDYYISYGKYLLVYDSQLIILPASPQKGPIQVYDKTNLRIEYRLYFSDKTMPTYKIVLIAVSCTTLIMIFIYFLYRKYKNKIESKNGKTKYNGPIREVWSNPEIDNTLNTIALDKKSNSIRPNPNVDTSYKSDIIEFSK